MDVFQAISNRRSIRKYLDIPIEMEKIGRILDAGRFAPSAGNNQPWKFILVFDQEKRTKVADACLQQHWMTTAPLHIIVVSEPMKQKRMYGDRGEQRYAFMDCAMAIQNMLLTAHADGLATCVVAAFEDEQLNREFFIPDNVVSVAVITIGYADETVQMPSRYSSENVTFFEQWGMRAKDFGAYYGYTSQHVQKLLKQGKVLLEKVTEKVQDVK